MAGETRQGPAGFTRPTKFVPSTRGTHHTTVSTTDDRGT